MIDTTSRIEFVPRLAAALVRLGTGDIGIVLLDLNLPDSQGMETFDQILAVVPDTPIIIFTATGYESLGIEAVGRGAYGHLPKSRFSSSLIAESLIGRAKHVEFEETLYIEKTRAETTLNSISDAVVTTDMRGNVDYLNQAAEMMTGWANDAALGRSIAEVMQLLNGTTRQPDRNPVELVLQMDEPMGLTAGTVLVHRNGSEAVIEDSAAPIHDSAGNLRGAVIVFHDISASKAMSEKMAYLAQHDFLTDLPNRFLVEDRITQAIQLAARRSATLAVLVLDLDNFKNVNDSAGHDVGDTLLRSVAKRLSACLRSSDTASRSGGDEFILMVLGDGKTDDFATVADKILQSFTEPHTIANHTFHVTTSIGISLYPADAQDTETLVRKADAAMYKAKHLGGNSYQFYSPDMQGEWTGRMSHAPFNREALVGQNLTEKQGGSEA